MPEQALAAGASEIRGQDRSHMWRKAVVISFALVTTIWLGYQMYRVLNVTGVTPLEWALLAIFVVNIAWISFAFSSAVAGFIVSLTEVGGAKRMHKPGDVPATRTALLFPVYNESVENVFATVLATMKSLEHKAPGAFECFILSDTTSPDVALEEEAGFRILQAKASGDCPVWYRRRTMNIARKSGNVHDFISRWGGRYDHMIIYDADSYIATDTLLELVTRMEADPDLGLLQTVPKLIGGESVFARAQQFAAAVYGPVLGRGISWWSQNEGNYWGHNAIIRVKAFADAAGLPVMPGRAPFGGHILSHDFVEAALLRRAGYKVRIAPELKGSYEEGPQTIIDLTIRDRRWCQGNLQHTAVLLRAAGITMTNRMHFAIGIFSYLASPVWLILILVGMALSLQNRFLRPEYFGDDVSLVPSWPVIDPALALNVFFATMAILLLPKLFGVIVALLRNSKERLLNPMQIFGGSLFETLISALVAPILMAAQTSSVVSILTGQDSGWTPQMRGSNGYQLKDVARRHAATTLLGVTLTLAALVISPVFAAWLAPATLGMMLAIPLSYYSGRAGPDDVSALLAIPEDKSPPRSHVDAIEARAEFSDLKVSTLQSLITSGEERRQREDLVDSHWPLVDMDVHAPLAMAEAKLFRTLNAEAFLRSLSKAELMAVLNTPRVLEDMGRKLV